MDKKGFHSETMEALVFLTNTFKSICSAVTHLIKCDNVAGYNHDSGEKLQYLHFGKITCLKKVMFLSSSFCSTSRVLLTVLINHVILKKLQSKNEYEEKEELYGGYGCSIFIIAVFTLREMFYIICDLQRLFYFLIKKFC